MTPFFGPRVQMRQFEQEDRCLDAVQASVGSNRDVLVFADLTMVPQRADLIRQLLVVSGDCTGIAPGPQVLGGIEAEATHSTHGSDPLRAEHRAMCLRSALDQGDLP